MRLPGWLQRHEVTVEAYLGDSAYGPQYDDPATVRCMIDDRRHLVRNANGDEVTSETTLYVGNLDANIPPESRVTVNGRTTTVLSVSRHDGAGLPTPDHLEIAVE